MSTYEVGAFEALEWAWNLLRVKSDVNVEDATNHILEMLSTLGSGTQVNFQQRTSALRASHR